MKSRSVMKGFTLVEMLLVATIISLIIYAGFSYFQQRTLQMTINRTSMQMQQILNAGLAYYVANSTWPVAAVSTATNLSTLQGAGFLPNKTIMIPLGGQ